MWFGRIASEKNLLPLPPRCLLCHQSWRYAMYLDHPKISATNSNTEPDRIERLNRVYGYAVALADVGGDKEFLAKLSHLHDHKGTLTIVWFDEPTDEQKQYFVSAWRSKVGDESICVEHEIAQPII
jgi:hypothetical protein